MKDAKEYMPGESKQSTTRRRKKNEWKTRRRRDRRDRRRTLKSNGRKRAGRKLDWKEPDELKEEE